MEGREAVIALPPKAGQDFNDLLEAAGQAVMAAIMDALPKEEEAAPEIGQHRPINYLPAPMICRLSAPTKAISPAPSRACGHCC